METQESYRIQKKIDICIEQFKFKFLKDFGVMPIVTYAGYIPLPKITLKDFEKIGNMAIPIVFKDEIASRIPDNIKVKYRDKRLVVIRQCICKLAYDMGYHIYPIADIIGFDHASVSHGKMKIKLLLESNDQLAVITMALIKNLIKEKYGIITDVQSDDTTTTNTQSDYVVNIA